MFVFSSAITREDVMRVSGRFPAGSLEKVQFAPETRRYLDTLNFTPEDIRQAASAMSVKLFATSSR